MNRKTKTIVACVFALAGLGIEACSGDLSLTGQHCPCIIGWQCCDNGANGGECIPADFVCEDAGKKKSSSSSDDDDETVDARVVSRHGESPLCIAADPTSVFWMNEDGVVWAESTVAPYVVASLTAVRPAGGCSMLRSGDSLVIASRDTASVIALSVAYEGAKPTLGQSQTPLASVLAPTSIVQDDAAFYVLSSTSGEVRRLPKSDGDAGADAGAPVVLGTGAANAYGLILNVDSFYWFDDGGLRQMPKAGGKVQTLATITLVGAVARGLCASNGSLFWFYDNDGIWTVPITGGVQHALPGGNLVSGLAVRPDALVALQDEDATLIPFEGGSSLTLFHYRSNATSLIAHGDLLFDTERYIWVEGDRSTISYRPVIENDPKLPAKP